MDFHSLTRRELQFLCKRNKIPANTTNISMADALTALQIVEGLDEYMSSNALLSPISVAKLPPSTATRTTRRKTAIKPEHQSSSISCDLMSKSLAGEMEQESDTVSVTKTPAARSTRKASIVTSCKKDVTVQSVYSTRRSTRLLEKCMVDLSLKTKDTVENKDTEHKISVADLEEKSEGAEGMLSRDLSASMENEWEILKNESESVVEDIAVIDANTETVNDAIGDEKESKNSLIQEETLQSDKAICEEGPEKDDNDQEIGGISDLECVNTERNNDTEVSKNNVLALDSLVQVDQKETEEAIQQHEKINNLDEYTMVDHQTKDDAGDSVTEEDEDSSGGYSDDTFSEASEADSNQAVLGSDVADEEMILSESEGSTTATPPSSPLAEVKTTPISSPFPDESISVQFPRPTTPSKNSAVKVVNVDKENDMEMIMMNVDNDDSGESKGETKEIKKKKVEFDEGNLKDVSMRQLVKMVKDLSIKNSNRTALKVLPGTNQIAE